MKNIYHSTFPLEHSGRSFSLSIEPAEEYINIDMRVNSGPVKTGLLTHTHQILENKFPGVLQTVCHNNDGLPFDEEVKDTQIGHLFEHILIQHLCEMRESEFYKVYSGETSWDWTVDPRGLFHIEISAGSNDMDIFPIALENSIILMEEIMASGETVKISKEAGEDKSPASHPLY